MHDIGQAGDLLPTQVEPPPTMYQCSITGQLFEEWTGGLYWSWEDKYFGPECIKDNAHYLYILDQVGGDAKAANEIIEQLKAV